MAGRFAGNVRDAPQVRQLPVFCTGEVVSALFGGAGVGVK